MTNIVRCDILRVVVTLLIMLTVLETYDQYLWCFDTCIGSARQTHFLVDTTRFRTHPAVLPILGILAITAIVNLCIVGG